MIHALRRRFVLGAMSAFGILFLLLLSAVAAASYIQIEHASTAFLESVLQPETQRRSDPDEINSERGHGFGGRDLHVGGGHYLIRVNASGEIDDIEDRGIWNADLTVARAISEMALDSGSDSGKVEGYRYLIQRAEDGSALMALMDDSMQTRMLMNLLRILGLICLCCMGMLFLIMLPVSAQVTRSYAANIERQKQFITNASHEIKTPVAIIRSNVDAMELILGENKWSRNIRGQTERMSALLQRLLFMARVDENSIVPAYGPLAFDALVQKELESYEEPMRERGVRFSCRISAPLHLRGNQEYLRQLIRLLMDNAVQYVDQGGEIALRLERRRQRARLQISNTVDALPACPPEALFDRFYRGDSARTQRGGGYGIGLSAARAIVEMHRGRVFAEYEGGRGICFTAELPLRL